MYTDTKNRIELRFLVIWGLLWSVPGLLLMVFSGAAPPVFILLAGVSAAAAGTGAWLKNRAHNRAATIIEVGIQVLFLNILFRIDGAVGAKAGTGLMGYFGAGALIYGLTELFGVFCRLTATRHGGGGNADGMSRPRFSMDPATDEAWLAQLAIWKEQKRRIDGWTAELPDRNIEAAAMNLIHPLLSPASQAAWDASWTYELALARTKEDPDHAAARIGGLPLLPADFVWPEKEGETYIYVATVDLARVAAEAPHPYLPAEGFLFFFSAESEYEDGRVVYSPGPCVVRADPSRRVYPEEETAMRVSPRWAFTSSEPAFWDDLERLGSSPDEEVVRAATILKWVPEAAHHLLGGPKEIQCPVEDDWEKLVQEGFGSAPELFDDEDDRKWILLLQLDSDRSIDMFWGDMGCIYYGIRLGDLKHRRFEKVVVACQFG